MGTTASTICWLGLSWGRPERPVRGLFAILNGSPTGVQIRCVPSAWASVAGRGSGSPCHCAASSSAHSAAKLRPREPSAVQAHRPAASSGPTSGRRSPEAQRTPTQVLTSPRSNAGASAAAAAGCSRLPSPARQRFQNFNPCVGRHISVSCQNVEESVPRHIRVLGREYQNPIGQDGAPVRRTKLPAAAALSRHGASGHGACLSTVQNSHC